LGFHALKSWINLASVGPRRVGVGLWGGKVLSGGRREFVRRPIPIGWRLDVANRFGQSYPGRSMAIVGIWGDRGYFRS
jgi:hypothetical protein